KDVPIAGVCIKQQIELHINVPVFSEFSLEHRAAILKHECEHILRNHILRSKELAPDVYSDEKKDIGTNILNSMKHKSINIAADCAVNSNIKGLPEGALYPKLFDLSNGETLEWYLEQLKDDKNEKAKQLQEFDGHDIWRDSEGTKEIIQEKLKQAVNKAAEKTRAAGRMSAEHELAIAGFNKASVTWQQQL